jgi:hypothetical protein
MEQLILIAATLKKQPTSAESNLYIQDEKWSSFALKTIFHGGE